MFAIEVADFKKKYKGTGAGVERVSFNINYGEVFGFIGPNGAGKSTTIRAIMGLLKPDSGLVDVAGKAVSRQQEKTCHCVGACEFAENFGYGRSDDGA